VGALLLLGLVAAPAATAQRLTSRPFLGLALSAGLAIACMWLGLVVAYVVPRVPPSFAILAVAAGGYALAYALTSREAEAPPEPEVVSAVNLGHPVL
jgi:zinc/manganese transport system permease protein